MGASTMTARTSTRTAKDIHLGRLVCPLAINRHQYHTNCGVRVELLTVRGLKRAFLAGRPLATQRTYVTTRVGAISLGPS